MLSVELAQVRAVCVYQPKVRIIDQVSSCLLSKSSVPTARACIKRRNCNPLRHAACKYPTHHCTEENACVRSACDEAPMSSVSSFLPAHAAHPSANLALHDVHPTGCSRLLRVLCSLVINTHVLLCRNHAVRTRARAPVAPSFTARFNII